MPDYSGNTFNDINPQYPEDTELAGYHAAAMRQVKRFLTQPDGLESIISEWINSDSDNSIKDALNKLIRVPGVGELYFTMDNNFNPNFMDYSQNIGPDMDNLYKDPMFNPIMQYEQAFYYYRYLCMQMDYKIKCKEYEKLCNNSQDTRNARRPE